MLTIKLKLEEAIEVNDYLNQYNNIVRFAYNRFQEDNSLSEVERQVKAKMNNIGLMDASFIKAACDNARCLKDPKVVFGGKYNWRRYNKGLISKEEYKTNKLKPITVRGSKLDNNGNRKFALDIIENNQIIFKPKKGIKIVAKLPRTKHNKILCKLQRLCELGECCFTCGITNTHIYITFDEAILREQKYRSIKKRILSIDLNPDYIAYVVRDKNKILHKEIVGLKELNEAETNKKKHEDFEISKRIVETAKHYRVSHIVYEKLTIKSSDKGKGKRFNKQCNNNWRRSRFIQNLVKRCNIVGIHIQEVIPEYSSFLGQINNPDDYDSIAAAIELSRRGLLYLRKYYYNENIEVKGEIIGIQKELPAFLADRWKKKLSCAGIFSTYLSLYEEIKKAKYSYRLLFDFKSFSFRLSSRKSLTYTFLYN